MTKVKVRIKNDQKVLKIGFFVKNLIKKCCQAVLEVENFDRKVELSVLFVNDEQMRVLNQKYRKKNKSTDVLSFPLMDDWGVEFCEVGGFIVLGDIVISAQTLIFQAKKYGHSIKRELAFLVVHSMLHLMGYDHEDNELARKNMRRKEKLVLVKLKL